MYYSCQRFASITRDIFEQYPLVRRNTAPTLSTPALLYPQVYVRELVTFIYSDFI